MVRETEIETCEYADQLSYALTHINEFQELIRFADTKAGAAITLVSGLLAVLLPSYDSVLSALSLPTNFWQFWIAILTLVLSTCFFITLMGVFYYAFLTFLPRLEKREYTPTVAFFLDCYNLGEDKFIQTVSSMSKEELLEHMLREVYLLSEILVPKFRAQRFCFNWLKLLLLFWSLAELSILSLS
jgi:hypothetical protein